MVETIRKCPSCGRSLGPLASRCFYCGPPAEPQTVPPPAPPAEIDFAPVQNAPPAPAAAAVEMEPNTRCPICKNPISAQVARVFSCPACQTKLECLFAAPAKPVQRKTLSQVCTFHPEVQAAVRCRTCRKAVCETCAFRSRMGAYCPDCATAPDETRSKGTTRNGILSLVFGVTGILVLGIMLVMSADGESKAAELVASLSIILAIAGVAMGFMSRDPARGRSLVGLIGLIVSFLLLGIYLLLIIAGFMAE